MTRSTLKATMRRVYALLGLVLAISLFAKFVDHIAPLRGSGLEAMLKDAYEFLRDMSLLIATGGVAYITNVYQKRSSFLAALKEEWRDIIAAKSALFSYTQLEKPSSEIYLVTFCKLSETIDNMRSVYQNVGETGDLVGLYPYAPLHDMRRALQTLDPRKILKRPTPRCVPWCAMRSCNRFMPCAKPSWRNSISRNRTIRCSFRADAGPKCRVRRAARAAGKNGSGRFRTASARRVLASISC